MVEMVWAVSKAVELEPTLCNLKPLALDNLTMCCVPRDMLYHLDNRSFLYICRRLQGNRLNHQLCTFQLEDQAEPVVEA